MKELRSEFIFPELLFPLMIQLEMFITVNHGFCYISTLSQNLWAKYARHKLSYEWL